MRGSSKGLSGNRLSAALYAMKPIDVKASLRIMLAEKFEYVRAEKRDHGRHAVPEEWFMLSFTILMETSRTTSERGRSNVWRPQVPMPFGTFISELVYLDTQSKKKQ